MLSKDLVASKAPDWSFFTCETRFEAKLLQHRPNNQEQIKEKNKRNALITENTILEKMYSRCSESTIFHEIDSLKAKKTRRKL